MRVEQRAAAERMLRMAKSKLGTSMSPDAKAWVEDNYLVATALLAEHPTDEDEPVTEEWLRDVGVEVNPLREMIEVGPAALWHFQKDVLGIDHPTGFWTIKTRGDVRRFCSALGIELQDVSK